MSATTNKKSHHYLSESYLKFFTNGEGNVIMYRKDAPHQGFPQKPKELGSHNYYYSQPTSDGGIDHNTLENVFSDIETHWPNVVKRLVENDKIDDISEHLYLFMCLHWARSPLIRDAHEKNFSEKNQVHYKRIE
jgi:hypothetical protein